VVLYVIAVRLFPLKPRVTVTDPRTEVDDICGDYVRCLHCDKSYVAYEMDRNTHDAQAHAICDSCAVGNRARHFD
jgi:hypothetical protein